MKLQNKFVQSFFIITLSFVIFSCTDSNPIKTIDIYNGGYRVLMGAVEKQNTEKIENILQEEKLDLNFADAVNGVSLLNWCIINNKKKSFEKLLQLGASPNWQDTGGQFATPITEAAQLTNATGYLQLAIKYGGDVNCLSKKIAGSENQTPLFGAIYSSDLENIKLLIVKGCDVNLTHGTYWTPLADALLHKKIKIAKYLIERGADFRNLKFKTNLGKDFNILDFLRSNEFFLNTEEYKIKMEVVDFLKTKGFDYWKYPIPDDVKNRHKDEPEYLLKY